MTPERLSTAGSGKYHTPSAGGPRPGLGCGDINEVMSDVNQTYSQVVLQKFLGEMMCSD